MRCNTHAAWMPTPEDNNGFQFAAMCKNWLTPQRPGPALQARQHVCVHACAHPAPHQHVWQVCPRALAHLTHRHRPKVSIVRHQAPVLVICTQEAQSLCSQASTCAPSSLMASSSALVHPREAPSARDAAITSMPSPRAPPRTRLPSLPPILPFVVHVCSCTRLHKAAHKAAHAHHRTHRLVKTCMLSQCINLSGGTMKPDVTATTVGASIETVCVDGEKSLRRHTCTPSRQTTRYSGPSSLTDRSKPLCVFVRCSCRTPTTPTTCLAAATRCTSATVTGGAAWWMV